MIVPKVGVHQPRETDPQLVSMDVIYELTNQLTDLTEENMVLANETGEKKPWKFGLSFALTILADLIVYTKFDCYEIGKTRNREFRPNHIYYAPRDGKTEYEMFDKELNILKEKANNLQRTQKFREKKQIMYDRLKAIRDKYLIPYEARRPIKTSFESRLIDLGYKTLNEDVKNKYLVMEMETNGCRPGSDDILSLSIYNPTTGICYNRFLALDRQPVVYSTNINGIHTSDLIKETPISQDELHQLIHYFDIPNKTILYYSEWTKRPDKPQFLKNYCKRRHLHGFDSFKFEDIRLLMPLRPHAADGQMLRDNVCKLLGIRGVEEIHSSSNGCLLEWKIFEKLEGKKLFAFGDELYSYKENLPVLIDFINYYEGLGEPIGVETFNKIGVPHEIYSCSFSEKGLKDMRKLPILLDQKMFEEILRKKLKAQKQTNQNPDLDGFPFEPIFLLRKDDANAYSASETTNMESESMKKMNQIVLEELTPFSRFIQTTIFKNLPISFNEIRISKDYKTLAYCNLSNDNSVLEVANSIGYGLFTQNETLTNPFSRKLFCEADGRETYLLTLDLEKERNYKGIDKITNLRLKIYKIDFENLEN